MKNKLNKKIYGFQKKLFFNIVITMVFVVACIFAVVIFIAKNAMNEADKERYRLVNEKAYLSFLRKYEELDSMTDSWILNDSVQMSLTDKTLSFNEQQRVIRSMAFLQISDVDYYIYLDNHQHIYSQKNIHIDDEDIVNSDIIQSLDRYAGSVLYWGEDTIFKGQGEYLFLVRYVRSMDYDCEPGILCLRLNRDFVKNIFETLENENPATHVLFGRNKKVCGMVSADDYIISESTLDWMKENLDTDIVMDSTGLLYSTTDDLTGFTVATYVPDDDLNASVRAIYKVFVVILLITILLVMVSCDFVTLRLTKPIALINKYMLNFNDERLDDRLEIRTNTELDTIADSYNAMIDHIGDLIDNIYKKEREMREQEIKSLVNQLHPHFLYNTLDNIYMLARINHDETIMKMIYSLTSFLRINLSNGAEDITVEKELEHVCAYMDIQNIRNNHLFEYHVDCPDRLKDVSICKVILQPLAENAIKHGFKNINDGGEIRIRISENGRYLHIEFENNGQLIEEVDAERLNEMAQDAIDHLIADPSSEKGGFGIVNVVKRLRLKYGDQMQFYYMRTDHTICVIDLPVLPEREDNSESEYIEKTE